MILLESGPVGACSRDSSWDGSGPQMGIGKKRKVFDPYSKILVGWSTCGVIDS